MEEPLPSQPAPKTCPKHGVVRNPFGQCVICRREMADDDGGEDPSGIRAAGMLLVLLGVIVAGVLFWKGTRRPPPPPPAVVAAVATTTPAAPIEEVSADEEDKVAAAQRRESDERRDRLQREMKDVPITLYSTPWCALCRTAATFLQSKGYAYREIDVEHDPAGLAAMTKVNPKNTVPTIVVGEEVIVGFGQGVVISAIYRAAAKNMPRP